MPSAPAPAPCTGAQAHGGLAGGREDQNSTLSFSERPGSSTPVHNTPAPAPHSSSTAVSTPQRPWSPLRTTCPWPCSSSWLLFLLLCSAGLLSLQGHHHPPPPVQSSPPGLLAPGSRLGTSAAPQLPTLSSRLPEEQLSAHSGGRDGGESDRERQCKKGRDEGERKEGGDRAWETVREPHAGK